MPDYDNTNRGVLFKNTDKKEENQPDYTGKVNVGGDEYLLAAWIKISKAGSKYMSLSVKPAEQKKPEPKKSNHFDDMTDDTPF